MGPHSVYLPLGNSDFPAFNSDNAATWFSNAEWCKAESCHLNVNFYSTAAMLEMQSTVIAMAIQSVCPSHAGTLSRRIKIGTWGLHSEVAKTL